MDAIKLLKEQHRLVEKLFKQFEDSDDEDEKQEIFNQIADNLAVHTSIEERFFYPTVRTNETEEQVVEAYDEHLGAKKLLLECLKSQGSPGFDGKVAALQGAIEHHVHEEEHEMFKQVKKVMDRDTLEALGEVMEKEGERLKAEGAPRRHIQPMSEQPEIGA